MSLTDMARSHIKELAREAFELDEVVVDEDGDLPFPCGSALVYVTIQAGGELVTAWSRAATGVAPSKAVLRELDEANARAVLARLYTNAGAVHVEATLPMVPLRPQDLLAMVAEVGHIADRVGSMLAAVHGGEVWRPQGVAASAVDD